MRKMKRMTIFLISCLLFVVMAGCSGNNSEGTSSETGAQDLPGTQTDAPAKPEQSTAMPTPDPNKQSTLVFTMYKNDSYLQDAKKAYEKKHPNIKIDLRYTIKNGSEDVSGVKQEKFQSTLIADFLKGEGPDMIVMDDALSVLLNHVGRFRLSSDSKLIVYTQGGDSVYAASMYGNNVLNMKQIYKGIMPHQMVWSPDNGKLLIVGSKLNEQAKSKEYIASKYQGLVIEFK